MTSERIARELKTVAKRIARSKRIDHHDALDLVAREIGFSSWYALTTKYKKGYRVSAEDLQRADALSKRINPAASAEDGQTDRCLQMFGNPGGEGGGYIGPHPYTFDVEMGDVRMWGRGWCIKVFEAPSRPPIIELTNKQSEANPIRNPEFVARAIAVATAKVEQVRARISSDWPRRSTKLDAKGRALHPLHRGLSDTWYCLHCDARLSAEDVAANLWHCPTCSASPLDIFNLPFWRQSEDEGANQVR